MGRGVKLKIEKEKEGKVAGIESFVEIHRLNINRNIKYLCVAKSYADCMLNKLLCFG